MPVTFYKNKEYDYDDFIRPILVQGNHISFENFVTTFPIYEVNEPEGTTLIQIQPDKILFEEYEKIKSSNQFRSIDIFTKERKEERNTIVFIYELDLLNKISYNDHSVVPSMMFWIEMKNSKIKDVVFEI